MKFEDLILRMGVEDGNKLLDNRASSFSIDHGEN